MKTIALREQELATLRRTFLRLPFIREVRPYGSRATNTARRVSDIDLAISAPEATAGQWSELVEALEEAPIIYEMDVVRIERLQNSKLVERIAREGVTIYPQKANG